MEIVIHGTKGGYRILFKTPGAPSIGSDIRNNESGEEALGKSAYSIFFAANGLVFTKYIIVRDTLRNDATGFIAFSLFLSQNKELANKGTDIKFILDELSNQYLENYVSNNSINRGETNIIQENWSFVSPILDKFTEHEKRQPNTETQAGSREAAFIFYDADSELVEYLSKPIQPEYNSFKQVLLISAKSQNNPTDLLNALRNSGVELKVDLKNEEFFLNNFNPSVGLTISANGKPLSDRKNKNAIRAKERVEIIYRKEYYEPIEVEGTLSKPESSIHKYLEINGNQISIKYRELNSDLKPIEKTINFDVTDWKGRSVTDAKITCKSDNETKPIENSSAHFQGEELARRWFVSFSNERLQAESKQLDLEKVSEDGTAIIPIVLNKHKLNVIAHEESMDGDILSDVTVDKIEFIGDEIGQTHRLTVTRKEFKSKSFDYSPLTDENPKHITLQRKEGGNKKRKTFEVFAGKFGTVLAGYSHEEDGSDIKVRPVEGYIFTRFKLDESKKIENYDGTLTAQYKKKKKAYTNAKLVGIAAVITVIIVFVAWVLLTQTQKSQSEQTQNPTIQQIEDYIKGDSLILADLDSLKLNFSGVLKTDQSARLDSAIQKRKFVDEWNIDGLKKMHYYTDQEAFISEIHKIDNTKYDVLKKTFVNITSWPLSQITDSLEKFLAASVPTTQNKPDDQKKPDDELKTVDEKKTDEGKNVPVDKKGASVPEIKPPQQGNVKVDNPATPPTDNNSPNLDIAKELASGTVTKDQLESWKKRGMDKYLQSIDLYLAFWKTINPNMQIEESRSLLKKIKGDKSLKKSALCNFLESVCKTQEVFDKYSATRGIGSQNTINELLSIVKL